MKRVRESPWLIVWSILLVVFAVALLVVHFVYPQLAPGASSDTAAQCIRQYSTESVKFCSGGNACKCRISNTDDLYWTPLASDGPCIPRPSCMQGTTSTIPIPAGANPLKEFCDKYGPLVLPYPPIEECPKIVKGTEECKDLGFDYSEVYSGSCCTVKKYRECEMGKIIKPTSIDSASPSQQGTSFEG